MVRLYSSDGTPMGQVRVGNGGEATFGNIHPGNYFVEVEAPGYLKAHEDATLPMSGDLRLQIYLQPEAKSPSLDISGGDVPVLAPKAKKELDQGREALQENNLDAARDHLEKAAELAPRHPDVLYSLASLNLKLHDFAKAEGLLQQSLQLYPKNVPTQVALGIVLTDERKFDAAAPQLEAVLAEIGQSWEGRWALARCYYHQKKFDLALVQSRQALKDSKGQAPEVALVIAASLTALAQYEESADVLRKFLAEHPDSSEAVRARRWLDYLKRTRRIS